MYLMAKQKASNEYECQYCDKSYKTIKGLDDHRKVKHTNEIRDSRDFLVPDESEIPMDRKKIIGAKCPWDNNMLHNKNVIGEPVLIDAKNRIFRVEFQCPYDSYVITRILKE